jgi:hypothetical protein
VKHFISQQLRHLGLGRHCNWLDEFNGLRCGEIHGRRAIALHLNLAVCTFAGLSSTSSASPIHGNGTTKPGKIDIEMHPGRD